MYFNRRKNFFSLYLSNRETIFIASFIWISMVGMGLIPYLQFGYSFADALFEASSGFSTTGSSIIEDVESQPKILLLWRSTTQWLGGMGVIVLLVSLLPSQSTGSKNLFQSEVPGPYKDGIVPQIRNSSRILWFIYIGLTGICFITYKILGMTWYEAINHALTSLATGGFSTSNSSLADFSAPLQWAVVFFMFLGGVNFAVYYFVFTFSYKKIFKNEEFRIYLKIILFFALSISILLLLFNQNGYSVEQCFRYGFFNTVSLITTTGYVNSDYELFPQYLQAIIFLLFFFGGSSGSTAGGIKIYRVILFFKSIIYEIKCILTNSIITSVKVNNDTVENEVLKKALTFIGIYFSFFLLGGIVFFASGVDMLTAFSVSISCIGNIGPGLGDVGPTENFAHMYSFHKIVCSFLMILGRLEFYTLLALFYPYFNRMGR